MLVINGINKNSIMFMINSGVVSPSDMKPSSNCKDN